MYWTHLQSKTCVLKVKSSCTCSSLVGRAQEGAVMRTLAPIHSTVVTRAHCVSGWGCVSVCVWGGGSERIPVNACGILHVY